MGGGFGNSGFCFCFHAKANTLTLGIYRNDAYANDVTWFDMVEGVSDEFVAHF